MKKIHLTIRLIAALVLMQAPTSYGQTIGKMTEIYYSAEGIAEISTAYGFTTGVTFGEKELVQTIVSGDPNGWTVVPNGNRIFIKQNTQTDTKNIRRTNLIVITDKREYNMTLHTGTAAKFIFNIRYRYDKPPESPIVAPTPTAPIEPTKAESIAQEKENKRLAELEKARLAKEAKQAQAQEKAERLAALKEAQEQAKAERLAALKESQTQARAQAQEKAERLAALKQAQAQEKAAHLAALKEEQARKAKGLQQTQSQTQPAQPTTQPIETKAKEYLNRNYIYSANTDFEITNVYDDGTNTYMEFKPKTTLPDVYAVNRDGYEEITAFRVSDNKIIVNKVAQSFSLRKNDKQRCIKNQSTDDRYKPRKSSN